jgi:hypothetical protein
MLQQKIVNQRISLRENREDEGNQETTKDNSEIQERTHVPEEAKNYPCNEDKHGALIVNLLIGDELQVLEK